MDEFGNYLGFVTEFKIKEQEFLKYEVENVGGAIHNELWVPSDKLQAFNEAIVEEIKVINVFIGDEFKQTSNQIIKDFINKLSQ
ncbi:hypothetical protein [Olleya sp. Bg11-27]|uniref:hypothetical protein n=1 Tax=Olleya sp. Bg11-27 TaxID=2058135 RepID=UPI001E3E183A|nr:hypothetical protein [Olleya sp. Bg11-27]